jgi:hypothetical protein
MEKKIYLISGIIIILLLAIVIIFSQNLINFGNTNLEFSYGPCDNNINPFNQSNLGIQETTWLNESTLQIKSYVSINCEEKIKKGDYTISNNNLILEYNSPRCGGFSPCARCMCAHELVYKIKNLEKKEYQFKLERLY